MPVLALERLAHTGQVLAVLLGAVPFAATGNDGFEAFLRALVFLALCAGLFWC